MRQHQPAHIGPGCVLGRLLRTQMEEGVIHRILIRRLAQEQVGAACQLDGLIARPRVTGVGERMTLRLDPVPE